MTRIAVVDVETTGLNPFRNDRIVEVALLVIRLDGKVLREFVTLINPERDIGPTHLHGLCTSDILHAPRFGEIAGELIEVLDGCAALAGHNVWFDHSFLEAEFSRLEYPFPPVPKYCTMALAGGGSLSCACADYGIAVEGEAHTAWHDARATARLLVTLLNDAPRKASEISNLPSVSWPTIPKCPVKPLSRDDSRRRQAEPPSYIQRLLTRVQPDVPPGDEASAVLAYTDLLVRALEDRHVTEEEGEALIDLAERWSIPAATVEKVHLDYLLRLGAAALADGMVTDVERRELCQVARLLGFECRNLDEILQMAAERTAEMQTEPAASVQRVGGEDLSGKRVCFTGECQCRFEGDPITRKKAIELATRCGMIVVESVTQRLDFLVVADPLTQSGKAKKARQYGIRVVHEPVFWRALGLQVR